MAHMFKVGDLVRYTGTFLLPGCGQFGVVTHVSDRGHYQVEFVSAHDDPVQARHTSGFNADGLELRQDATETALDCASL